MRASSGVRYVFGDHLGSSSVTADVNGADVKRQLYKAWGETRSTSTVATNYAYAGQYAYDDQATEFGLLFYRSRFYDNALGRFVSADTIIPESSQGVQAWDRFAGMNNNPVRWNDPSGHCIDPSECEMPSVPTSSQQEDPYSEYNSGQHACAGCHYTRGTNLTRLTNEQWADADHNARIAAAQGGTALVLGAGGAYAANSVIANAILGASCADGDCTNEATSLYRAVGSRELNDIMKTGGFRPDPSGGSMDAKWFWEGLNSAKGFMEKFPSLTKIVEVKVPTAILEAGYRVSNQDLLGPAVAFMDDSLDILNKNIIAIQEIITK